RNGDMIVIVGEMDGKPGLLEPVAAAAHAGEQHDVHAIVQVPEPIGEHLVHSSTPCLSSLSVLSPFSRASQCGIWMRQAPNMPRSMLTSSRRGNHSCPVPVSTSTASSPSRISVHSISKA